MNAAAPLRTPCAAALDDLMKRCDGVAAAMLALRDGRPFAERLRGKLEPGKFAAMASSLVALGHTVLRELAAGELDHLIVEGGEGKLVVCSVPSGNQLLVLAVLAQRDARLGLVLGHAKACARQVAAIIQR